MVRKIPTFIGIGAERSGTTWCWTCLDEHPDVCMSHPKELNYFNQHYSRGVEWYRQHYPAPARQAVGEISPLYMDDFTVCDRIAMDFPWVKLIVVLRNPYDRALSHLRMDLQNRLGELSGATLDDAVKLAQADEKYIRRSLYYRALAPYYERFSDKRISVLFYDDLKSEPKRFARALYSSVGVTADFVPLCVGRIINKTQDYRSRVLFSLLRSVSRSAMKTKFTRGILERLYATGLRESVLDRIQVDRGRPSFCFDEVFGPAARESIAGDLSDLAGRLRVQIPAPWMQASTYTVQGDRSK